MQTSSLIDNETNMQVEDSEGDWTTPLIAYLKVGVGVLPDEKGAAKKMQGQKYNLTMILK